MNVGVAHEAVTAVVLSEHREPPLRPAVGLVSVKRFEDVNLAGGAVDVEPRLLRLVLVDALTGEEVDDVVGPVFVSVRGCDLDFKWICQKKVEDL